MTPARRFSLAVLILMIAAVPAFATHSWGGYHWARTANPFTLKIIDATTNGWTTYYNTAVGDWTTSSVMSLSSSTGTAGKRCTAVAGKVQVCNNTYGSNGWLGLASISITGGTHITQGTAKMNDTYFNTSTYNNANEKLHVMCQEIGHTFGLDHQSTDGSSLNTCMDYFSNTGANATSTLSTHPNQHDYDQLVTIYTHLDSSTTLAASAVFPNGMDAAGEDPSSWGRLVSSEGRSEIYELDFGGGNKTFTFVTWADDTHGRSNGGK